MIQFLIMLFLALLIFYTIINIILTVATLLDLVYNGETGYLLSTIIWWAIVSIGWSVYFSYQLYN